MFGKTVYLFLLVSFFYIIIDNSIYLKMSKKLKKNIEICTKR